MNISESAATRPSAFVTVSSRKQAGSTTHQQPSSHMDFCNGGVHRTLSYKRGLGLRYNAICIRQPDETSERRRSTKQDLRISCRALVCALSLMLSIKKTGYASFPRQSTKKAIRILSIPPTAVQLPESKASEPRLV